MSTPTVEQLIDPAFIQDLPDLSLEEIRLRRGLCQDAEEALSLQRRLVQGRLDIVQAELYRRSGGGAEIDAAAIVDALPSILVEHGDRHLGPGRLTSIDPEERRLGADYDAFSRLLDEIVDGARLTMLARESDTEIHHIADELDQLERSVSKQRHQLHEHIDQFQAEMVRRYKSGEASVDGLLGN